MQVNSVGAKVLEFIADFGKPTAPLPAAIVACVPTKVHIEGVGETEFKISPTEITDAIKAGLDQPIMPEPEVFFLQLNSLLVYPDLTPEVFGLHPLTDDLSIGTVYLIFGYTQNWSCYV